MLKIIASFFLIIGIGALGFWSYRLYEQKTALQKELAEINNKIQPLGEENGELVSEINYLRDPDNLEKQLRSRFNYIRPGEKLIVVVPPTENRD